MAETAAHLVDNIIPWVPIRQYVLSVPIPLRYWMASNKKLTAKVHRILASVVEEFYTDQQTNDETFSGSVAFVQRFGSALNLNVHFHMLQMEGSYLKRSTGKHKFKRARAPSDQDISQLLERICTRVINLLRRLGYLGDPQEAPTPADPLLDEEPTYASCMSASVKQRIALGLRRGQRVRFIGSGFGYEGEMPEFKASRCVTMNGFSLHAATKIPRHRRDQVERLIRYVARPSLAIDRMSLTEEGDIKYELKRKWSNGITHVVLSPTELIEKLCALVPLPYMHLVRYWGVLAPHSKLRKGVIPGKTRAELKRDRQENRDKEEGKRVANGSWAKLLARVFAIDVSTCSDCDGSMRIIAQITRTEVIEKILTHCGEAARPPPIAPARVSCMFAG